jgi:hypothetical protein
MNDVDRAKDFEDLPPKEEPDDAPTPAAKAPAAAPPETSHKALSPRALGLVGLAALLPLAAQRAQSACHENRRAAAGFGPNRPRRPGTRR